MPIRFMDEIVIALFWGHLQLILGVGENARNGNCKRTEEQYRSSIGGCFELADSKFFSSRDSKVDCNQLWVRKAASPRYWD